MKTNGSFSRTISIWIVTILAVTALVIGSSALICRTQISELISYHRTEEMSDQGSEFDMQLSEKEHERDKKDVLLKAVSPLSSSQKASLIILGVFWLAMLLLYWFSVTIMLAERAELIRFNRRFWFWFAFFTNIVAVIVFTVIKKLFVKKCSKCGNCQMYGEYCTECGNALQRKCPQCGQKLNDSASYCPRCGQKTEN